MVPPTVLRNQTSGRGVDPNESTAVARRPTSERETPFPVVTAGRETNSTRGTRNRAKLERLAADATRVEHPPIPGTSNPCGNHVPVGHARHLLVLAFSYSVS